MDLSLKYFISLVGTSDLRVNTSLHVLYSATEMYLRRSLLQAAQVKNHSYAGAAKVI